MVSTEELKEIGDFVNNSRAILSVLIEYFEFKNNEGLRTTLYCSQKFLNEAMERLSLLW